MWILADKSTRDHSLQVYFKHSLDKTLFGCMLYAHKKFIGLIFFGRDFVIYTRNRIHNPEQ